MIEVFGLAFPRCLGWYPGRGATCLGAPRASGEGPQVSLE